MGKVEPSISQILAKEAPSKSSKSIQKSAKDSVGEFHKMLEQENSPEDSGIKISNHAIKRLSERNLSMDSGEFLKIKEALTKLKSKGGNDSLVVTKNAAYIVDVGNHTVVTAMDKNSLSENVFTKIDSTVFMD